MKNLLLFTLILAMLSLPFGCKKETDKPDPEPNPGTHEIIVADITKVMDAETRAAISAIDTANYTFTFNGTTGLLNNLAIGDILVDSASEFAGYGYLRKVTGIQNTKSEITVTTEPAGITDAVKQGEIHFNTGALSINNITHMELADGVTLKSLKGTDFTVFDMDYDMDFDNLNVNGNTSLNIDLFFDFEWSCDCFALPPEVIIDTFASGVDLNQSASINIVSESGTTIGLDEPISLAKFYFEPWTFSLGPVPVVFVPIVDLIMDVDGHVSANFSTGASESFHGKLGIGYGPVQGWEPITQTDFTYDYYPPVLELSAGIETHVGPEVALMLYGALGPFVNTVGCSKLDAEMDTQTQLWDLEYSVGAQAAVGLKIDVFIFKEEVKKEFCLFEQTLMSLNDEPMENGVFWEYPIDGHWYSLGSNINLQARTSGADPSEIQFVVDGTIIGSDTEAPYEYSWNTTGFEHGEHNLTVNYIINGSIVSTDEITISLLNAQWETINLSSLGQSNETINYDVFFSDTDRGWMVGGTAYGFGGYLLFTNDAGATWEKISPDDFLITMKQILFINENDIAIRMFDGSIFTAGDWTKEFGYYSSSDWVVTFTDYDIKSLAMSSEGYITAVGKKWQDERYYMLTVNAVTHELGSETLIEHYYNDDPTASEVYFRNTFGLVYNIKDQSNPLKQYITKSTDGGLSWETQTLNASGITRDDRIFDAFFVDEQKGWLVGHESQGFAFVIITNDGGQTWEKINVEQANSFGSVHFLSDMEGYATNNTMDYGDDPTYKLFHTLDGGYTWEPVELVYTKLPMYKVTFKGPYIGYAVGQSADTYRFSVGK